MYTLCKLLSNFYRKMLTSTALIYKTSDANPSPEPPPNRVGETSGGAGGGDTSDETETISVAAECETDDTPPSSRKEEPPTDDVCPICFGDFDIPCRAQCGHWYCGSCILQYWNFSAVMQPCKCPMCSQRITSLIPEASLSHKHQAEITKVLRNVRVYNRLFVGGISGFFLKFLYIPLFMKRMFWEMLNPDRPGLHLQEMRAIALFLGILYSFIPLDFLQIGRRNILDMFDYSAFALSFVMYLVGLYLRRRRERNFRELQNVPHEEFLR